MKSSIRRSSLLLLAALAVALLFTTVNASALKSENKPRAAFPAASNGGSGGNSGSGGSGGGGGNGNNPVIPTAANAKNKQCVPYYEVRNRIMNLYQGSCNKYARAAVRGAFHDSTFSLNLQKNNPGINGRADGSLMRTFPGANPPAEVDRPENNGLQDYVSQLNGIKQGLSNDKVINISSGDILHMAGILAVLSCPGGPQIQMYVGRDEATHPAPDGLLPSVTAPAKDLLALFADKSFDTRDTMALIGAHTCGNQFHVDESQSGKQFDSTPGVWDVSFYSQTLTNSQGSNIFRLASDIALSTSPLSSKEFNRFVDETDDWASKYADAHRRMSILGFDASKLVDCSEVLPPSINLRNMYVAGDVGNKGNINQDLTVDQSKLLAAEHTYRAPWFPANGALPGASG